MPELKFENYLSTLTPPVCLNCARLLIIVSGNKNASVYILLNVVFVELHLFTRHSPYDKNLAIEGCY